MPAQPAPTGHEVRLLRTTELRVIDDGKGKRTIQGYAAVYNAPSEVLGGWFVETIRAGAFTEAIKRSDVRCLFNHDANFIFGRAKAGTLRLSEDSRGLRMECDLPDTQAARDLALSIQRGDVDGQSFSFTTKKDRWTFNNDPDTPSERELLEVDELFDVGPVVYPAYSDTSVGMRSRDLNREIFERARREAGADRPRSVRASIAIAEAEL